MKLLSGLLIILSFTLLSGRQSVDVRGQSVSDDNIAKINNGNLSQEEVIELIGTPTYVPEYTKDTWYYVQRSLTRRAWLEPKVVEQRIVKVTFDQRNKANKAELITDSHNDNIAIQSTYTESHGTEKSGVQKFVQNIGRFNKTTDGKKTKQKRK